MDFDRPRRKLQEVNLTALIDIVFHLMVFVMLTTTFVVSESMELSLPSGHGGAGGGTGHVLRIQIGSDGNLLVDNQAMDNDHLSTFLANKLASDPDARIAILTTPNVSVQQLVNVMDTVYLTGGHNVQVDKAG